MRRKCAGTTNVFGAAPASNAACVAASQFGASASARRRVSRNGVRYRPDEAPLPKVVCAGMDDVAKEIRAAAVREGVPLMENVELARALYAQVKIEEFIPVELVEPVAEVLKLVKAMDDAKREDADLDAIDL